MKQESIEIPQGKRTKFYRFFEILPAFLSFGAVILMVILSIFSPLVASIYLLLIIATVLVKAVGIAFQTYNGYRKMKREVQVDWLAKLNKLEKSSELKPSEVVNAVIIAAYNEPYEVLEPTIQSVAATDYPNQNLVIFLAYEERGGVEIEKTAKKLQSEFSQTFKDFKIVKHPKDLPNEVVGKGGNITFAGRALA